MQMFGGVQCIFQQAGSGHRTYSTRNRSDPGGAFAGWSEFNVAQQAPVGLAVDAHIDDDRPRLDPLTLHQTGDTGRYHDQISSANVLFEVAGEAMGHGGGAASQEQFQRHRATDNVGCAHDDRIQTVQIDTGALQQRDDPLWRAGA